MLTVFLFSTESGIARKYSQHYLVATNLPPKQFISNEDCFFSEREYRSPIQVCYKISSRSLSYNITSNVSIHKSPNYKFLSNSPWSIPKQQFLNLPIILVQFIHLNESISISGYIGSSINLEL